jgi:hypothetical protein
VKKVVLKPGVRLNVGAINAGKAKSRYQGTSPMITGTAAPRMPPITIVDMNNR